MNGSCVVCGCPDIDDTHDKDECIKYLKETLQGQMNLARSLITKLEGDPCTCDWEGNKDHLHILDTKNHSIFVGPIETVALENRKVAYHGVGIHHANLKTDDYNVLKFNYCPFCGKKLTEKN